MSLDMRRMQILSGLLKESDEFDESEILSEGGWASERPAVEEENAETQLKEGPVRFEDIPDGPLKEAIEKHIRAEIKKELAAYLKESEEDSKKNIPTLADVMKSDTEWMYKSQGSPKNSVKGHVNLGFMGIGFK